jgi:hypothetical protein
MSPKTSMPDASAGTIAHRAQKENRVRIGGHHRVTNRAVRVPVVSCRAVAAVACGPSTRDFSPEADVDRPV